MNERALKPDLWVFLEREEAIMVMARAMRPVSMRRFSEGPPVPGRDSYQTFLSEEAFEKTKVSALKAIADATLAYEGLMAAFALATRVEAKVVKPKRKTRA